MRNRAAVAFAAIILALVCGARAPLSDQLQDGNEALLRGDYSTAFQLFKPLAEAGDEAAQNNLGILYREGKGVSQSYADAIKWFQLSASQGSMWAQYNLGMAYEHGEGVPKNIQTALKWYRLSADQGDSEAQVRLGFMYQEGIGVTQDRNEAIKWYKLADKQNNRKAREALAWLSENINDYAFVMPTFWLLLSSNAVGDGMLLFRRYSVIVEKQNLKEIDSRKSDELRVISPPGLLVNSMIYSCQRDRQKSDFLTVHLPDNAHPTSFEHQEWISKLEMRILADGRAGSVVGEYIKGDIFIDADDYESKGDFLKLLSASRLIFEFGSKRDRITFAVDDQVGSARLGLFMREYLPRLPIFASGLRFLTNADMLRSCAGYKNTGRF
jgi:Sel1 repeat-containing protein